MKFQPGIVLRTEDDFKEAINEAASQQLIVIDTEYTKVERYGEQHLIGVSWGYPIGSVFRSYYAPFRHEYFPTYWNLDPVLLQEFNRFPRNATQVYHNWPADHGVLLKEGIDFSDRFIFDTMIAQHLCDENWTSYSLDYLVNRKFKLRKGSLTELEQSLDDQYGKNKGWPHIHPDNMGKYACRDVFLTYMLYVDASAGLQRQRLQSLYERYEAFIKVLFKVVDRGVHVDEDLALRLQTEARTEMQHLASKYEFKLSSQQKVANYLHSPDHLGVPVSYRTAGGAPSTSRVHLQRYQDRARKSSTQGEEVINFVQDVLRYRTLDKAVSTWYTGFLTKRAADGLLHPGLTIAGGGGKDEDRKGGTKTGRLSCREPNLQQIPRKGEAKYLIVPPPGFAYIEADLSQAELRTIASLLETRCKDSRMADAFRNGTDLHAQTADAMGLFKYMEFKDGRQVGKTCNFSLGYRAGIEQLQHILYRDAGIDASLTDVAKWHRAWHETYPGVRLLNEKAQAQAEEVGYVRMWNGRRRHLTGKDCYKAFNSVVQGGVGQIMIECMIEVDKLYPEFCMILQVHDSLKFYLPADTWEDDVKKIVEIMERIPSDVFGLPFAAEYTCQAVAI